MPSRLLKIFLILMVAFSGLAVLAPLVDAQNQKDVTFEATVDETTVELGSFVRLTLTVTGLQNVNPIKLPEIDGFQSRYLGPSTRVSIVNGSFSSSIAFLYALYPQRAGKLTIPAMQISLENQPYTSKPISIEVVTAGTQAGTPSDQAVHAPAELRDRLFVTLEPSKTQAYENERVPIKIRLFVSGISLQNVQMPEFEHSGFLVDDYARPRQYTQSVNGINYQVVEFVTAVYASRLGSLTLGPVKLNCEVLSRRESRRSPTGHLDSFFDDDFFDNFFGNYDVRPLTLESKPVTMDVQALPAAGQPPNFSGGIGTFDFTMSATPLEVKVGDPVTIRMRLSGEGNMKSVTLPSLENSVALKDQFKLYDPQVTEKDGEKILEQVLIPKNEKVTEVPAATFSYFDPKSTQYLTITRGPFGLKVSPAPEGSGRVTTPVVSTSAENLPPEQFGQDIVYLKNSPGLWHKRKGEAFPSLIYWGVLVFILISWLVLYLFYRVTHRIRTDERFARRLLAPRRARQGLALAERHLGKGASREFYDTVFKTLQDYFNGKFHLASGNVTALSIRAIVVERQGQALEVLTKIDNIFVECDAMRYGALTVDKARMAQCYKNLCEVIDYFERFVK